eukprot:359079-Chlamydomonas_euryale.AAC.1
MFLPTHRLVRALNCLLQLVVRQLGVPIERVVMQRCATTWLRACAARRLEADRFDLSVGGGWCEDMSD